LDSFFSGSQQQQQQLQQYTEKKTPWDIEDKINPNVVKKFGDFV